MQIGSNLHIIMIPPFYSHEVKLILKSEMTYFLWNPHVNHFKSLNRSWDFLKLQSQGFSPWHYWHLEPGPSLWWEAVLCIVRCWAASLASAKEIHQMQLDHSPHYNMQNPFQELLKVPPGESHSQLRNLVIVGTHHSRKFYVMDKPNVDSQQLPWMKGREWSSRK